MEVCFLIFDEAIKLSTACLNSISVCQTALGLQKFTLSVSGNLQPTGGERMPTSQSRWKGPFGTEASRAERRSAACGVTIIIWLVVSKIFYFHPYLGKIPNWTNIFQRG